jgi:hypothetical protein
MKSFESSYFIVCLILVGLSAPANAGTITGAFSVETDMGFSDQFSKIDNIIDQSGLLQPYNGNNFDDYINNSSTKHEFGYINQEWFSKDFGESNVTGEIIFNLGDIFYVDKLAIWNEDSHGLSTFQISTSVNKSDWLTVTGVETATNNKINENYSAEVYEFNSSTLAQYVKISVLSVYPNPFIYGTNLDGSQYVITGDSLNVATLGEVAFSTTPVPEPTTLLLFGTGLVGLLGLRRSKQ